MISVSFFQYDFLGMIFWVLFLGMSMIFWVGIDEEFHRLNLRETFCLGRRLFLVVIDEEFHGLYLRENFCLGLKTFLDGNR